MSTGKLTSKAKAIAITPQAVRDALKPGDSDETGCVILGLNPRDTPFATFSEWASDIDAEAYCDL